MSLCRPCHNPQEFQHFSCTAAGAMQSLCCCRIAIARKNQLPPIHGRRISSRLPWHLPPDASAVPSARAPPRILRSIHTIRDSLLRSKKRGSAAVPAAKARTGVGSSSRTAFVTVAFMASAGFFASSCLSKDLEIVSGAGELTNEILGRMSTLREPYRAFPLLTNRHVETIFASFFRSRPTIRFKRECLRMIDNGTVTLDWPIMGDDQELWREKLPQNAPILILLPGLTGGSHDTYVRHALVKARQQGWRPLVFNSRGCSDSPVTSPQFYSASFTEDLRQIVRHVAHRFPNSRIYAAGWSLGANILVRYIGQEGDKCQLAAAVSLCNPFDLVVADEDFHKGFNNVYDKSLARNLRMILNKHVSLFEDIGGEYNIPMAANAKTVRDFDDGLTRVAFGYKSVDDYYFDASSSRSVKDVKIPLLCIQAANDPIAPSRGIPRAAIEANPNCLLVVTPEGGHLGWVAGKNAPFGGAWTDPVVLEYLQTVESLYKDGKASQKQVPREDEHLEIVWTS